MDFRTQVEIKKSNSSIDHNTRIMLFGSCFSEHIGNKLKQNRFRVNTNPFGILYNPLSVSTVINRLISRKDFNEQDLVFHNNVYQSFLHHGSFSDSDKTNCLKKISESFDDAAEFIRETDFFLFTFGTAYIYRLKKTGDIVANCHKFSPDTFIRQRLSINEIVEEWSAIIETLLNINSSVRIIFTVSPIRHWKDGAHENQISKSILHLSINQLMEKFSTTLSYFPSYEILLDELRDYRFFAEDMVHPAQVAIDYIWGKFSESYFKEKTIEINSEIQKINRSLSHRPLHDNNENYHHFLQQTIQKMVSLQQKYPQIDFNSDIITLKEKLNK